MSDSDHRVHLAGDAARRVARDDAQDAQHEQSWIVRVAPDPDTPGGYVVRAVRDVATVTTDDGQMWLDGDEGTGALRLDWLGEQWDTALTSGGFHRTSQWHNDGPGAYHAHAERR